MDKTPKKDIDNFHQEHSIVNREAFVFSEGILMQRFVKKTNKHCFPIFPRWRPGSMQHDFNIDGWDYFMDCKDVKLDILADGKARSHPLQAGVDRLFKSAM